MATTTPAERTLQELVSDTMKTSPRTLAYWRLQDPGILRALERFAAGPEWTGAEPLETYQSDVQEAFDGLNSAMLRQEREGWSSDGLLDRLPGPADLSLVFGGKAARRGTPPRSISEKLVECLVDSASFSSSRVFTVSRSDVAAADLPDCVTHFSRRNLDDAERGADEFEDVIRTVLSEWTGRHPSKTVVIYFTLGQHKGTDPFARNVNAARNFAEALRRVSAAFGEGGTNFRVVVTGTDATNPRSHPDATEAIGDATYLCPSYRIEDRKFVYAISKLLQYYTIADAVVDILDKKSLSDVQGLRTSLRDGIGRMSAAVDAAGEDGAYNEKVGITRDELDEISARWDDIEKAVMPHVMMARGISICYTPLHGNAWTQEALERSGSPRAYIVQQIVPRLKNAISIDKAAKTHFCSQCRAS